MNQDLALWVASIASMLGLLGGIMRWVVAQIRDVRKEAADEHAALRIEIAKLDDRDRANMELIRAQIGEFRDRSEQRVMDAIDRTATRLTSERQRSEDMLRDDMRRGGSARQ
ncbi:MAG: hypothetical protein JOY66_07885 [Acetobacteraceae bacterium]|nr:hypothetical protein [Acetobacteraceae bacterium]